MPFVLEKELKALKIKADIHIAVDLIALHVSQNIYGKVHFLSLEIENNTHPIYKKIDRNNILSVFIQSKKRFEYLFPNSNLPVFYVQNSPVFKNEFSNQIRDKILFGQEQYKNHFQ